MEMEKDTTLKKLLEYEDYTIKKLGHNKSGNPQLFICRELSWLGDLKPGDKVAVCRKGNTLVIFSLPSGGE